jgi:hypothetical protein
MECNQAFSLHYHRPDSPEGIRLVALFVGRNVPGVVIGSRQVAMTEIVASVPQSSDSGTPSAVFISSLFASTCSRTVEQVFGTLAQETSNCK